MAKRWELFFILLRYEFLLCCCLGMDSESAGGFYRTEKGSTAVADVSLITDIYLGEDNGFPVKLSITISSAQVERNITLKKNTEISHNVPVFLQRADKIQAYTVQRDKEVFYYDDIKAEASFMIWRTSLTRDNVNKTTFVYYGTFESEGQIFLVEPATERYSVRKMKNNKQQLFDYILTPKSDLKYQHRRKEDFLSSKFRRATTDFKIEAFFVVDYSVYQFWFSKTAGSPEERSTTAISRVRQNYAFILNGVNLAYRSVSGRGYTISCVFAGLYIAETPCAAPFVHNNLFYGTDGLKLDAGKALDGFRDWAEKVLTVRYDHAFLFHGYDMITSEEKKDIAGLAYRPGLCSSNRYSITEDHDFNTYVVPIASHELGHNLGAIHDGDTNPCPWTDHYIMGLPLTPGNSRELTYRRSVFSSCSLEYFDEYIKRMEREGTNCMRTIDADYKGIDLQPYMNDLPGQVYTPDVQCQYAYGPGAYLYRRLYEGDYSSICTGMACGKSEQRRYWISIPWDGTSCGSQKVCMAGSCLVSPAAPAYRNGQCLFGDTPYKVTFLNETCAEYLGAESNAYRCYGYKHECCETCQRHQQNLRGPADCAYGDKQPTCVAMPLWWCYTDSNIAVCCKKCRENVITIPGCEYGDRSVDCATMPLQWCSIQSNAKICCLRCSGRTQAISGASNATSSTRIVTINPAVTPKLQTVFKQTTDVPRLDLTKCPEVTNVKPPKTTALVGTRKTNGINLNTKAEACIQLYIMLVAILLL